MRPRSKARLVSRVVPTWALATLAPWALGVGVLVSFTADAGQGSAADWNVAPLTARARLAAANSDVGFAQAAAGGKTLAAEPLAPIQTARLEIGAPQDLGEAPDELAPRVELKSDAAADAADFPAVDRTNKGDPLIALRPAYETRRVIPDSPPAALGIAEPAELSFDIGGAAKEPAVALAPRAVMPAGDEADVASQTPKATTSPATTRKTAALASPTQKGPSTTSPGSAPRADANVVQDIYERAQHGATPRVARAIALGSSTPAQPDLTPIEVSSFAGATLALGRELRGSRPDYAASINPEKLDREKRCLAEAVYFESRSEPEQGQAAVAQVVLNRVQSGLYPSTICGVVYQNRSHYKACQFSFACEGRSLRITERESWATAVRIASEVMDGRTYISEVGRSTHYHTDYVHPRWARALTKMDVIGRHIFYKLKPGQT
jgi:spore germination cell wall hydrolase CwlJ-like protein